MVSCKLGGSRKLEWIPIISKWQLYVSHVFYDLQIVYTSQQEARFVDLYLAPFDPDDIAHYSLRYNSDLRLVFSVTLRSGVGVLPSPRAFAQFTVPVDVAET